MKEVRRLRRQGLTYAAIGARLGISKGRAAQYYWAKYQQPEVDAKTGKRPWWKGER